MRSPRRTQADWNRVAIRHFTRVLAAAEAVPGLKKLGPSIGWAADVTLVTSTVMTGLNKKYRGKAKPTDVLSFSAPDYFRDKGFLGELVVCLPVMKKQAQALKHPAEKELDVLLVHGLLHLLGFDHEKGKKEAADMARWELKLLHAVGIAGEGLIGRI